MIQPIGVCNWRRWGERHLRIHTTFNKIESRHRGSIFARIVFVELKPPTNMMTLTPLLSAALPVYVGPVVALIAGILILVKPDLLAKIVAIYLIVVGALGLLG